MEQATVWDAIDRDKFAPEGDVLAQLLRAVPLGQDDRALVMRVARESVPVMRAKWDESEGAARKAVLEYGIAANEVDMPAFIKAAEPLLAEYRSKPEIEALYRRIRDLA